MIPLAWPPLVVPMTGTIEVDWPIAVPTVRLVGGSTKPLIRNGRNCFESSHARATAASVLFALRCVTNCWASAVARAVEPPVVGGLLGAVVVGTGFEVSVGVGVGSAAGAEEVCGPGDGSAESFDDTRPKPITPPIARMAIRKTSVRMMTNPARFFGGPPSPEPPQF